MLASQRAGPASRPRYGGIPRIHADAAGARSDRVQPRGRRVEWNRPMENLCRSWLLLKCPTWRAPRGGLICSRARSPRGALIREPSLIVSAQLREPKIVADLFLVLSYSPTHRL